MTWWQRLMCWVSVACRPPMAESSPYRSDEESARAKADRLESEILILRQKEGAARPFKWFLAGGVCAVAACLLLLQQTNTTAVVAQPPTATQQPSTSAAAETWVSEPMLAPFWAQALGLAPQSPQNVCEVKPPPTCPPAVGTAVRASPR